MSSNYDQYLSHHFERIASPGTLRRNTLAVMDHHGKHFPSDKQANILEIGPGFGGLLEHLRHDCGYVNVKAVDVSAEVVDRCNQVLPGSTVRTDDTTEFVEHFENEFDLVIMLHVLEHVRKDEVVPLLRAVHRALKPGGKLIVELPNSAHPITGPYNLFHDFTHTVGYTDQSLGFVLREAGFREVTVYGCKTPRRNVLRLVQRTAQDVIELAATICLRVFLPRQYVTMATALGACAIK